MVPTLIGNNQQTNSSAGCERTVGCTNSCATETPWAGLPVVGVQYVDHMLAVARARSKQEAAAAAARWAICGRGGRVFDIKLGVVTFEPMAVHPQQRTQAPRQPLKQKQKQKQKQPTSKTKTKQQKRKQKPRPPQQTSMEEQLGTPARASLLLRLGTPARTSVMLRLGTPAPDAPAGNTARTPLMLRLGTPARTTPLSARSNPRNLFP